MSQSPMRLVPLLVGVLGVVAVASARSPLISRVVDSDTAVARQPRDGMNLPDPDSFFAAVRENIGYSNRVQNEYAYNERRTELRTNPFGQLGTGDDLLYEVIPLPEGTGHTRQLLERGGVAVEDAEVERVEPAPRREPRRRSTAEDVWEVLDFELVRREIFEGRPAVVLAFKPRQGAKAVTRQGRLASAFSGEVWVDEQAREVRHVEATTTKTISYGWGVLARLGKGTMATLEREPIEGGVWMLTSVRVTGTGRAMFWLRRLTIDYEVTWFAYRRLAAIPG